MIAYILTKSRWQS